MPGSNRARWRPGVGTNPPTGYGNAPPSLLPGFREEAGCRGWDVRRRQATVGLTSSRPAGPAGTVHVLLDDAFCDR